MKDIFLMLMFNLRKLHNLHNGLPKAYINMNAELTNGFEKDFKLMNDAVLEKSVEKVRNQRDIKLIAAEARKNYLVLEQN